MPDILSQLEAAAGLQESASGFIATPDADDDAFYAVCRALDFRAIADELRRLRTDNERFRAELERLQEVVGPADYELIEAALAAREGGK